MERIYSLIPDGKIVADIGTDHGQLAVALAERQKAKKIIATDISASSLQKLILRIQGTPLEKRIKTFVTDGLEGLGKEGIQVAVIAGMGGVLIGKILEKAGTIPNLESLVLCPHVGVEELRPKLTDLGFAVKKEDFVEEEGKLYPLLFASKGEEAYTTFGEKKFGHYMPEHPNEAFQKFVYKEKKTRQKLLQNNSKLPEKRRDELKRELIEIGKVEKTIETHRNL
ncbi:hypothetical protein HMPREF1987_02040 [Peptostreptococcaceae bacterium oral taxon 113 str. W5053]|nr:hypothetical protein HMPREF1987_02040 [Peptostreptococcaceae bacterium oral taxon 113 str. W5053]